MAVKITNQMILNIAETAKLNLTNEERSRAKRDIQGFLDFASGLNELDTSSSESVANDSVQQSRLREDLVISQAESIMVNAPAKKDGQFQVPTTVK